MVWSYRPFRCSLVRWRPRVEECCPSAKACAQRIRRKLVQSMSEHFTARKYIKGNDFTKHSVCASANFPSCSSAVHEILNQLRVSGFICWVDSWKEGLRSKRQTEQSTSLSVGATTSQLTRRLIRSIQLQESNPNFVETLRDCDIDGINFGVQRTGDLRYNCSRRIQTDWVTLVFETDNFC